MKSSPSGRLVAEFKCKCEYHWLIELFDFSPGNSLGFYIASIEEDGSTHTTTREAFQAKRFTKEEAEAAGARLLSKLGLWRATEHGFCG